MDNSLTVTVPRWVGTKEAALILRLSPAYVSAVKKQMGLKGAKIFRIDRFLDWLEAHPEFRVADSYPQKQHAKSG